MDSRRESESVIHGESFRLNISTPAKIETGLSSSVMRRHDWGLWGTVRYGRVRYGTSRYAGYPTYVKWLVFICLSVIRVDVFFVNFSAFGLIIHKFNSKKEVKDGI
jgi:hypothetical protein